MALLGRDNAGDPALPGLLDQLAAQSTYHEQLVLIAAAAAGEDGRLSAALTHPSPKMRSVAIDHLNPERLTAESTLTTMLNGSADDRRNLRRFINRHGLTAVAEGIVDRIRDEFGDQEAGALLMTCTPDTARRLLPDTFTGMPNLRRFARRHPTILLDFLEAELDGQSAFQRDLLWRDVDPAVSELALAAPDRLLRIIEERGPSWILPRGITPVLGSLIRLDAARIARLLVDPEVVSQVKRWRRLPPAVTRNVHRFAFDDQVAIARALFPKENLLISWLGSLAPGHRAAVFTRATENLTTPTQIWSPAFLEILPHELRHTEVRRILGLRSIRTSEALTLRYTALLPFDEARAPLVAATRRADAEQRAVGYDLLIACARADRSPAVMAEALSACDRLRNEQDPVRLAAVQSLAAAPPAQIDGETLGPLRQLSHAVTEARDTSASTLHRFTSLAVMVLVDAADAPASPRFRFAIELLDQIADRTGSLSLSHLIRLLPPGAETALVAALLPRMEQAAKVGDYGLIFSLEWSLGKRAWCHEGFQRLLEAATAAPSDRVAISALRAWLADPRRRSERVARVLANDESAMAVPVVLEAVAGGRQDLLDVMLRTRPLRGRFIQKGVRFVPVIDGGFHRWLPRQCDAYRHQLDALIADPATNESLASDAIHSLAHLPEIGAAALEPYLASSRVRFTEAALSGLAQTDEPGKMLPRLLAEAGTDRARVAVYAATRSARFVPRAELGPALTGVLRSDSVKVTSQKEVARVLADLRPFGALELLLSVMANDRAHRDLRIAVGRALRGFLDDERAWRVLATLPAGSTDEAQSLLATAPSQLASRHRPRFAELIVETCRDASPLVQGEAFTSLAAWFPWDSRAPEVACKVIGDIDQGQAWGEALHALTTMVRAGVGWAETSDLVQRLAARDDDPALQAGADRDRPSAQRLMAVLHSVTQRPYSSEEERSTREGLSRIADLLGEHPGLAHAEFMVRIAMIDWASPAPALIALAAQLDHRPLLTHQTMAALAIHLGRDDSWGLDTFDHAADELIKLGTSGSGALALQLVSSVGKQFNWPESWRTRLRALRSHPVTDVAAMAGQVWTAVE